MQYLVIGYIVFSGLMASGKYSNSGQHITRFLHRSMLTIALDKMFCCYFFQPEKLKVPVNRSPAEPGYTLLSQTV